MNNNEHPIDYEGIVCEVGIPYNLSMLVKDCLAEYADLEEHQTWNDFVIEGPLNAHIPPTIPWVDITFALKSRKHKGKRHFVIIYISTPEFVQTYKDTKKEINQKALELAKNLDENDANNAIDCVYHLFFDCGNHISNEMNGCKEMIDISTIEGYAKNPPHHNFAVSRYCFNFDVPVADSTMAIMQRVCNPVLITANNLEEFPSSEEVDDLFFNRTDESFDDEECDEDVLSDLECEMFRRTFQAIVAQAAKMERSILAKKMLKQGKSKNEIKELFSISSKQLKDILALPDVDDNAIIKGTIEPEELFDV